MTPWGEIRRLIIHKITGRFFSHSFKRGRKWTAFFAATMALFFLGGMTYVIWSIPDLRALETVGQDEPAVVYSLEGVELARYVAADDRPFLTATATPNYLAMAVVAAEDPAFFTHSGINVTDALRRLFKFQSPRNTLTQRLARLYLAETYQNTLPLGVRFIEAFTAIALERKFTKRELIALYLHFAKFGGTVEGVENASKEYFNKPAKELLPHEAAILAALPGAPGRYHPRAHPSVAKRKRNELLVWLAAGKVISKDTLEKYIKLPVKTVRSVKAMKPEGVASYFTEYLREYLKKWCKKNNKNLYGDGLRIYTTLHARLQTHAEAAMREHLSKHQLRLDRWLAGGEPWKKDSSILERAMRLSDRYRTLKQTGVSESEIKANFRKKTKMRVFTWFKKSNYTDTLLSPWDSLKYYARYLEPGMVTIDQRTGNILAWVGGLNRRFFQYDHAIVGKRQVGSTFKPFVYGAAFEKGREPCSRLVNQPLTITAPDGAKWMPNNADYDYCGEVSLRYALVHSLNVVTARLIQEIGAQTVADFAQKMGIQSALKPIPSLALGVCDLSVAELTSAYTPFFTQGVRHPATFLVRIEDRAGRILENFIPEAARVTSETTAYTMVEMLRAVATNGTAADVRNLANLAWNLDVGGKTGTTQNNSDGWFVGATPYFTTGVWVGCSDRSVGFGRFTELGRGSYMAMPIWSIFMGKVYRDKDLKYQVERRFMPPPGFELKTYCYGDPVLLAKSDSLSAEKEEETGDGVKKEDKPEEKEEKKENNEPKDEFIEVD